MPSLPASMSGAIPKIHFAGLHQAVSPLLNRRYCAHNGVSQQLWVKVVSFSIESERMGMILCASQTVATPFTR